MKRHLKWVILVSVLVIVLIACLVSLYLSNRVFGVTDYALEVDCGLGEERQLKIVQLTDLHNNTFGSGNERLVAAVAKEEPDAIFVTGDLLNSYEENTGIAVGLLRQLVKLAPTYVSMGNHEEGNMQNYGTDLYTLYAETGAVVLDDTWIDTELCGVPVRIGGCYRYCTTGDTFMIDYEQTDSLKLLLCHMPAAWSKWSAFDLWDVNVVFSGHAHGGQIRLPFIGGLYAPDEGFFPGRTCGVYESDDPDEYLVLSRGLGGSKPVPRFNNMPELVSVTITCK